MDERGPIWYFSVTGKDNNKSVVIDFEFSDKEKEQFKNTSAPEELANKDFNELATSDEMELNENIGDEFDTSNLYSFLKDAMYKFESLNLDYAESAKELEQALMSNFNITAKNKLGADFSLNENGVTELERPKDKNGKGIKKGDRFKHIKHNLFGRVKQFGVDNNDQITIIPDWLTTNWLKKGETPYAGVIYPDEIEVVESDSLNEEDRTGSYVFSNNEFLNALILDASLEHLKKESPELLEFDLMEAIYIFKHDYNEDHPFFHYLNNLLKKEQFKGSAALNTYDDLEENGKAIYDELVSGEEFYKEKFLEGSYEDVVGESEIRSNANGRGQNAKPENFPDNLKRKGIEENDDFKKINEDTKYIVVDDDFNRVHYPDLIGKTFDNPPSFAKVKTVENNESNKTFHYYINLDERGEFNADVRDENDNTVLEITGDDFEMGVLKHKHDHDGLWRHLINLGIIKHGDKLVCDETGEVIEEKSKDIQEKVETIAESYGDRYEQIVFLDGSEADHALNILMQDGNEEAIEYLKQWHYPGEHDGREDLGTGTSDKTFKKDGYIMFWNNPIGYIGLVYDTEFEKEIEEDSQTKRHLAGQREKKAPLGKHAPHSQKAKN
jgi:hypothetical protein